MSHDELLEAGFKYFPRNRMTTDIVCDSLYQMYVGDDNNTRYFINIEFYDFRRYGESYDGWQMVVSYNNGFDDNGRGGDFIRITHPLRPIDSAQYAIAYAKQCYQRLHPNHHESNDVQA